jgi:biotin carboxyl carrier protein
MQIEDIERLALLLRDSQASELTLKQGAARLTLRKPAIGGAAEIVEAEEWTPEETVDSTLEGELREEEKASGVTVVAPLVGFFRNAKPVVGVGSAVKAGKTIGIIEAMKLINDIKAPVDGVVTEMPVEDGIPVEYGQPLFVIQPVE